MKVRRFLAGWVRGWARRRQGDDVTPVRLERRRVYILPTGFGLSYAAIVFAMLLGSMNYNNSLGFALTFLLVGLGLVAMHYCHRNLTGITISGVQVGEAFAGESLAIRVGLANPTALRRMEILVDCPGTQRETVVHSLPPASRALATLELATQRRGVLRPERLTVSTRFPFGLFRAWSWVHLPIEALVYPKPAGLQSPPPDSVALRGSSGRGMRGTEDFRGFREYVPGDSQRHIAWKALARGAPLMVKEYAGAAQAPLVFSFDAVEAVGLEARLSQLCNWILDADRQGRAFGLQLPGRRIGLGAGSEHRRRCLQALALFHE